MAGLTRDGFTPSTLLEIQTRIKTKLEAASPGIDLTPESPDGQEVEIIAFELKMLWDELHLVHNSYNPDIAVGDGLKNLGHITGIAYETASRSQVELALTGTAGTQVPAGSILTDSNGYEFATELLAIIPSTVTAVAKLSGPILVPSGATFIISSPITGWVAATQAVDGIQGAAPQTETAFRNLRNSTVMRNFTSIPNTIQSRLNELGVKQVLVVNNDTGGVLADGTPANTIHVTVGEIENITDADIALVILKTKGLIVPTFGTTAVVVQDTQGNNHTINFSKAAQVDVYMDIEVTFLDEDIAGATDNMRAALLTHINSLLTDEDVIQSRMYGIITPYGKAQVNKLEIGRAANSTAAANLVLTAGEYASSEAGFINITTV